MPNQHSLKLPNGLVWAYHGTTTRFSGSHLLNGIPKTTFPGDWLGHGIYFWEGDWDRAMEWATTRVVPKHGGKPAVLGAVIDLSSCLDLTITQYRNVLRQFQNKILQQIIADGSISRYRQDELWREFDCAAIESVLESDRLNLHHGKYTTVRGAFEEGKPLTETAQGITTSFRDKTHIQINVVDRSAIKSMQYAL